MASSYRVILNLLCSALIRAGPVWIPFGRKRNPFSIPATDIQNAKVLLTLFGGKEAYKDSTFAE
jgi:hypothetical protein